MTPWLEEHVSEVTDTLMSRMNRDACMGIYHRFQMVYFPSSPGNRGGLAVVASGEADEIIANGWMPVNGALEDAMSLTRPQVRSRMADAARCLPILNPDED